MHFENLHVYFISNLLDLLYFLAAFWILRYMLSLLIFVSFLFLATFFSIMREYKVELYICILGAFESHGTLVVPNVSVLAPERLSASARRRQEIQVPARPMSSKNRASKTQYYCNAERLHDVMIQRQLSVCLFRVSGFQILEHGRQD